MAVGDVYKLRILVIDTGSGLTAENSIAFRNVQAPLTGTDQESLVATFRSVAESAYCSCFSNRYNITKYSVVDLPENLVSYEEDVSPVASGVQTGDMLPAQTSAVLSIRTTHLGRRGRGRIFLPPSTEVANQSEGLVASAHIDNLVTFAGAVEAMRGTGLLPDSWEYGVWSVSDQAFYLGVSLTPRNRWGTQRGRTR